MLASKLIKWTAAAAATTLLSVAPAFAGHVSHKHLAAKKHAVHGAVSTTKTVKTKTAAPSHKAKALAKHAKHVARRHHRPAASTAQKHTAAPLDKTAPALNNM
jgi:hypothetical protein